MIKDRIQKPSKLLELKYNCPICANNDHDWLQVYTENNSQLNKMENLYIGWCEQNKDHILMKVN